MIKSMTGYGQGKNSVDGRDYTVEIKTINHRYNDMTVKLPRYLNFLEDKIRKYICNFCNNIRVSILFYSPTFSICRWRDSFL